MLDGRRSVGQSGNRDCASSKYICWTVGSWLASLGTETTRVPNIYARRSAVGLFSLGTDTLRAPNIYVGWSAVGWPVWEQRLRNMDIYNLFKLIAFGVRCEVQTSHLSHKSQTLLRNANVTECFQIVRRSPRSRDRCCKASIDPADAFLTHVPRATLQISPTPYLVSVFSEALLQRTGRNAARTIIIW